MNDQKLRRHECSGLGARAKRQNTNAHQAEATGPTRKQQVIYAQSSLDSNQLARLHSSLCQSSSATTNIINQHNSAHQTRFQGARPQFIAKHHQENSNDHPRHSIQPPTFNKDGRQFVPLDSSLQDEEISSYWSDSTLSNCDRDSAASQLEDFSCTRLMQTQLLASCSNNAQPDRPAGLEQQPSEQQQTDSSRCNSAAGHPQRNVRKRVMANERERERTKSLNQALEILRNRLPVPEAEKRSKIQTLRMAKEYIEFLARFKHIAQAAQPDHSHSLQQPPQECQTTQDVSTLDEQRQYDNKSRVHERSDCPQQQQPVPDHGQNHQPDSPLTYKFYKFRLKSYTRCD